MALHAVAPTFATSDAARTDSASMVVWVFGL